MTYISIAELAAEQKLSPGAAPFIPLELTIDHMSIQDWRAFEAHLAQRAESGAPVGASEIDKPIAEAHVCPTCRQRLTYQPYQQEQPRRYWAFAVCMACNHALEF